MENLQSENQEIIQQSDNQEILKPRIYNDLRLGEKMALNREFNGQNISVSLRLLLLLSVLVSVTGGFLWMFETVFSSVPNPWRYHIGLLLFKIGQVLILIIFPLLFGKQNKKREKGYFKLLGKKICIIFIVSLIIISVSIILHLIYLMPGLHFKWLNSSSYWIFLVGLAGFCVVMIKLVIDSQKDLTKHDAEFCEWLEKEKNIIKENRILK